MNPVALLFSLARSRGNKFVTAQVGGFLGNRRTKDLDPSSTLKYGLCSFYLGILMVYQGYLGGGGLGKDQGLEALRLRAQCTSRCRGGLDILIVGSLALLGIVLV